MSPIEKLILSCLETPLDIESLSMMTLLMPSVLKENLNSLLNRKRIELNKSGDYKKMDSYISNGGTLAADPIENQTTDSTDHRLTLRIPKQLMDMVDAKRKQRVGKISRNLWILEVIERASRE